MKATAVTANSTVILMKCGCRGTAHDSKTGRVICLTHMCEEQADTLPNLSSRKAECTSCKKLIKSKLDLPFFVFRADSETDAFYCGCLGWE